MMQLAVIALLLPSAQTFDGSRWLGSPAAARPPRGGRGPSSVTPSPGAVTRWATVEEQQPAEPSGNTEATTTATEWRRLQRKRRAPKRQHHRVRAVRRVGRRPVPTIAVVGRPNVGKSTLANRVCDAMGGAAGAIVHNEPGVTRDRVYKRGEWGGRAFDVVDTGGLVFDDADGLFASEIRAQASIALDEACAVVMVVDGREGRTALDEDIADFLRRFRHGGCGPRKNARALPAVVAVNKCERVGSEAQNAADFWSLGLGEPLACSAVHGNGVAEVLDALLPAIDAERARILEDAATARRRRDDDADDAAVYDDSATTISVALVGRPNVGKSSLLNRLVGEERSIVSEVAGTTRDAIDEAVALADDDDNDDSSDTAKKTKTVLRFVDTAGVRRRARMDRNAKTKGTEEAMVGRALRAVRRSDVVLLVLDATVEPTDQDAVLARRIKEDGRACVILVNKWDAKQDKDATSTVTVAKDVKAKLADVGAYADVAFVSAKTGQRCATLYDAVVKAAANHRKRVPTPALNEVLRDAVRWHAPPASVAAKGKSGKIYYVSQIATRPPTLVAICNDPKLFTDNYQRYLERRLREALDFDGTPIRLIFRAKRLREQDRDDAKRRRAMATPL